MAIDVNIAQALQSYRKLRHIQAPGTLTFPANFMLVAAMNPCPCGFYGDPTEECTCAASMELPL